MRSSRQLRAIGAVSMVAMALPIACGEIIGLGDPKLGAGGGGDGGDGGVLGGSGGEGGDGGDGAAGGGSPCVGCIGEVLWSRSYGITGNSVATRVAATPFGGVVVAGFADGQVDFGDGPTDAVGDGRALVVLNLDASGVPIWSRRYAAAGDEVVEALAVLPDGDVIAVGSFDAELDFGAFSAMTSGAGDNDGFVVRLDGDTGEAQWLVVLGGLDDQFLRDVAVDGDRIAVIGDFRGEASIHGTNLMSQGDADVVLVGMDTSGNVSETLVLATPAAELGQQVVFAANGDVLAAGEFETALPVGALTLPNGSQLDAFLVQVSLADGAATWAQAIRGNNFQYARGLERQGDRVLVAGGFTSEARFGAQQLTALYAAQHYVGIATASGEPLSIEGFAEVAAGDAAGRVIVPAFDDAGRILLTGWFEGAARFGDASFRSSAEDIFVAKVDGEGGVVWSRVFGAEGADRARDVAALGEEAVVVGSFENTVTFLEAEACPATSCWFVARLGR